MSNVIEFKPRAKPEEPKKVIDQSDRKSAPLYSVKPGLNNRVELWSPPFFGVEFLIWGSGSNEGPPDLPNPTGGGTPVANRPVAHQKLYAVAA